MRTEKEILEAFAFFVFMSNAAEASANAEDQSKASLLYMMADAMLWTVGKGLPGGFGMVLEDFKRRQKAEQRADRN